MNEDLEEIASDLEEALGIPIADPDLLMQVIRRIVATPDMEDDEME